MEGAHRVESGIFREGGRNRGPWRRNSSVRSRGTNTSEAEAKREISVLFLTFSCRKFRI